MEKFGGTPNRKNEGLTERESALMQKAGAHLRSLKEQVARVEWCLEEYRKSPASGEKWRWMMSDLEILSNMQALSKDLVNNLRHEGLSKTSGGWPKGTLDWRK